MDATKDKTMSSSKPTTKAERRALQEAQRAKKAAATASSDKMLIPVQVPIEAPRKSVPLWPNGIAKKKVTKLLENASTSELIHPSFVQFAKSLFSSANALTDFDKALGFYDAFMQLLNDFLEASSDDYAHAFFKRLDANIKFLKQCGFMTLALFNIASALQTVTGALLSAGGKTKDTFVKQAVDRFVNMRIKHALVDIVNILSDPFTHGFVKEQGTIMLIDDGLGEYMSEFHVVCERLNLKIILCQTHNTCFVSNTKCLLIPLEDIPMYSKSIHSLIVKVNAVFSDGYVQVKAGIGSVLKYLQLTMPSLNVVGLCEAYKFCEMPHAHPDCGNINTATNENELDLAYDITNDLPYLICERGLVRTSTSTPIIYSIPPYGHYEKDDSKDEQHDKWRMSTFPPGPYVPD